MSETLTFEKVLEIFKETDKQFKETREQFQEMSKESDRKFQETREQFQETREQFKETREQFKEMSKESDRKFQETREQFQEMSKESDRKFQESREQFKETREQFKEMSKETDKKFQETDKLFKETDKKLRKLEDLFVGHWGKLIESLVQGDLIRLLKERNIIVERTQERTKGIYNGENYEIDIIAKNGIDVVFVEIKTTLQSKHVKRFVNRLKIVKDIFPEFSQNKIYGAMAFLVANEMSDVYAEKQGLFVIKATGKSSSIVNAPDFSPKAF